MIELLRTFTDGLDHERFWIVHRWVYPLESLTQPPE